MQKQDLADHAVIGAKWIGAFAISQWVGMPDMVRFLIIFMGLDMFTGILAAFIQGTLCSTASLKGIAKKAAMLCMVFVAHILEMAFGKEYHAETGLAFALSINEAISIVENCARSGVPIPAYLVAGLLKLKKMAPRATPEQLRELETEGIIQSKTEAVSYPTGPGEKTILSKTVETVLPPSEPSV